VLESGSILRKPVIAYHTYGTPGKPVVWVCHALTANSDVFDWWAGLFGDSDLFNPRDYYIVCANVLASCYGTEGPLSIPNDSNVPYYHDFPVVTIRDFVEAHEKLRKHLSISRIHLVLGGSLGGQQVLEWVLKKPDLFEQIALIATNARHSAWGIAFNESQRMAIEADQTWPERNPRSGDAGMRAARAMALLSYRHYDAYVRAQTDENPIINGYKAASYQQYQGEKLSKRFNAFSYYRLSQAMDTHHIGRGRGDIKAVLQGIKARTMVIGISSDVLFPVAEQRFLAENIPGAELKIIDSYYGHDGFLTETAKLGEILGRFLNNKMND
jgi:homoserine O-acetyltransferase/O-succinyltransferase